MSTQLPIRPETRGKMTEGFCTPTEDKHPQQVSIPPKRVLPIVFLPGIMGSNLRMTRTRQDELKMGNNIAWRPDRAREALALLRAKPNRRQEQLDPAATEVDIYEAKTGPTGDATESPEHRHNNGRIWVSLDVQTETPVLMDDPATASPRRSKEEKARERGWGEIYFDSYRGILEICETSLNRTYWGWERIVDTAPTEWEAHTTPKLTALTKADLLNATKGCWFPVHAMGYNWLRSSKRAAVELRKRILALIDRYIEQGYQCEKVILVTHSMGGIVARALIHPSIGKMGDKILGVVHGVMPATGSPAAYKRMRCGFEEAMLGFDPAPKVIGNYGTEVTAVLANSPGALELLPSKAFGNGWLQIKRDGELLKSLPASGDPYEEIYKLRGRWFGLLRDDWINPAEQEEAGFERTCRYLDAAKRFHNDIEATYHGTSFAHYGADAHRPSWRHVVWNLQATTPKIGWDALQIEADDGKGQLILRAPGHQGQGATAKYSATLGPSDGAADETVPLQSSEHQLLSGKFTGIFRQSGYEHQGSYKNIHAVHSTLFSLIRIIETMKWEGKCLAPL